MHVQGGGGVRAAQRPTKTEHSTSRDAFGSPDGTRAAVGRRSLVLLGCGCAFSRDLARPGLGRSRLLHGLVPRGRVEEVGGGGEGDGEEEAESSAGKDVVVSGAEQEQEEEEEAAEVFLLAASSFLLFVTGCFLFCVCVLPDECKLWVLLGADFWHDSIFSTSPGPRWIHVLRQSSAQRTVWKYRRCSTFAVVDVALIPQRQSRLYREVHKTRSSTGCSSAEEGEFAAVVQHFSASVHLDVKAQGGGDAGSVLLPAQLVCHVQTTTTTHNHHTNRLQFSVTFFLCSLSDQPQRSADG